MQSRRPLRAGSVGLAGSPAPAADKRMLIRRHVRPAWIAAERAGVDAFWPTIRRRHSPRWSTGCFARYGERWGRHWLDIARYSD